MNVLLIISFYFMNFPVARGSVCPDGFEEFTQKDGCLISIETGLSLIDLLLDHDCNGSLEMCYNSSKQYCASRGSMPAKILNYFDNSFVQGMIQKTRIDHYIGVERQSNGLWLYADGIRSTYSNWAIGEPNSRPGSDCVIISPSGTRNWYAVDCVSTRPFLCSTDPGDYGRTTVQSLTTAVSSIPPSTTSDQETCDPGWSYNEKNRFCYYCYCQTSNWYNWTSSEENCQARGAHLVSIHSYEEEEFVVALFGEALSQLGYNSCGATYTWIGLNGSGQVGNGYWTDGSPVDFTIQINLPQSYPFYFWRIHTYESGPLDKRTCVSHWDEDSPDSLLFSYVCKK